MRVAVWRTGHEIADTVTEAVAASLAQYQKSETWLSTDDHLNYWRECLFNPDAHIGYGILRGMQDVFKLADKRNEPWFNLDRGYFKPSHYNGYYRLSLRGTQHTGAIQNWMLDTKRMNTLALDIKPWRGFAPHLPVLVCPPTQAICKFFNIEWAQTLPKCFKIREKGDTSPLNFSDYNYVLTFNSSVGWQALQAGIPCVSDPTHSMVGKWYHNISLDKLADAQYADRHKLFAAMANLQLSLQEMRDGMLWPLMSKLLSHEQST